MGEFQATIEYLKQASYTHRLTIFWTLLIAVLLWVLVAVQEVTSLVLLAKKGVPRSVSIAGIALLAVSLTALLIIIAVPALINEYQVLAANLPEYLNSGGDKLSIFLQKRFAVTYTFNFRTLAEQTRKFLSAVDFEQIRNLAMTTGSTLLSGYSLALTVINLFLLPLFVFYTTRDLHVIHSFLAGFLPKDVRTQVQFVGGQILKHVYAFFKGQCTVALALAVIYSLGLSLVGLPSGVLVGTLAGLLGIIPYLGVTTGVLLATLITLFSDPSLSQFLKVWAVFGVGQTLEGTVLTPKIVGESVGIHPFGVMLALLVGGKLFGLVGLILAIPAAASVRVLFRYLRNLLDDSFDPASAVKVYREGLGENNE